MTPTAWLRCTYRVQCSPTFRFKDLANQVPYLAELGVSHLYLSPIFSATKGSTHGYDVVDYGHINAELGGMPAFDALVATAREHQLKLLIDFVPNHMGVSGLMNPWWTDVLEKGSASPFGDFFDIQWKCDGHERVLLPILVDHYGKELGEGKLRLVFRDKFTLGYQDLSLPINDAGQRMLTERAGSVEPHKFIDAINAAGPNDEAKDFLHAVLEAQHYRLARWQVGTHEINYRRFFAIDSLVGLHMEKQAVFDASHALLAELIQTEKVSGVRIDHIDGLRRPSEYLTRLRALAPDPAGVPIYVEKILGQHEWLPKDWPVQGTTGYEFIHSLCNVFVQSENRHSFDETYEDYIGPFPAYEDQVYNNKRLVITELFANAISNLGNELSQLVNADRRWRDLTRHELTHALSEVIANLQVYRTYRDSVAVAVRSDANVVQAACERAVLRNPQADPEPFNFVRDVLVGDYPPKEASLEFRAEFVDWVLTVQQYTGAVMAKAVEDTTFYTFNRLVGLNEVGGFPDVFGGALEVFHAANLDRRERFPQCMLTTSTHDTKVSEDVRARLYALSELADEWKQWLKVWHELTDSKTCSIAGLPAPDRNDRYRLFQILLGSWPLDAQAETASWQQRLQAYFRKAVCEAKRHTSDLNPNTEYLTACDNFVASVLADAEGFMPHFIACADRVARLGMVNSLAQVALKLTVPGVPDIYQGNEGWDFSLVDPDNRRPVNFALLAATAKQEQGPVEELLVTWRTGKIKILVTQGILHLRKLIPNVFDFGTYEALNAEGPFAQNVVAFVRWHGSQGVLVAVPRLFSKLGAPPLGAVWENTTLAFDSTTMTGVNVLTGAALPEVSAIPIYSLLAELPVAVIHLRRSVPETQDSSD